MLTDSNIYMYYDAEHNVVIIIQLIMICVEPPKKGECMSAKSPDCVFYIQKENNNKRKEKMEELVQCPCTAVTPKGGEITTQ